MYREIRTYKRKGAGLRPPLQTGLLYICGQASILVFSPVPLPLVPRRLCFHVLSQATHPKKRVHVAR